MTLKKVALFTLIGISSIGFTSCKITDLNKSGAIPDADKLSVRVSVENNELLTKANIEVAPGEEDIQTLYLLFFKYTTDGSGQYINYLEVPNPMAGTNIDLNIQGQGLDNSTSYSILAVANISDDIYIVGSLNSWFAGFSGLTENEAMARAEAYVSGAAGNVETDNSNRIQSNMILMSANVTKLETEPILKIALTRAVARFDIVNLDNATHNLVSASIWNAAMNARVWTGTAAEPTINHLERFYGVTTEDDGAGGKKDITGGLYAFPNFSINPGLDKITTCLVVGIQEKGSPSVTYYRMNINGSGSSQNLKRNNVYRATIRNVIEAGAASEVEAWETQDEPHIDYIINSWGLDEEGSVVTNGISTLATPVSLVNLDPDGDSREFTIFTSGPGTLEISSSITDNGIDVTLIGNTLYVTADALTDVAERNGKITLSFSGLKLDILFIQKPDETLFLSLNKAGTLSFTPYGVNPIIGGPIQVNTSGPWKAYIHNPNAGANPGFAFNQVNGTTDIPETTITQAENGGSNILQIYTTGDNPYDTKREAFFRIELIDDISVNRALELSQRVGGGIKVTPDSGSIAFTAAGAPSGVSGAVPGGTFTFAVDPDFTDTGSGIVINDWNVELEGTNASLFEVTKHYDDTVLENNYFTVSAIGTEGTYANNSQAALSAKIKVSLAGSSAVPPVYINVSQAIYSLTISAPSGYIIPVTGGTLSDITVSSAAGMKWSAEITAQGSAGVHEGWLLDASNAQVTSVSGQSLSTPLKVTFPMIMYPNINITPTVTIKITLDGTSRNTTIVVAQNMLTPVPVSILNMSNGYARLTGSNSYFAGYRDFLASVTLYGVNGVVKTASTAPNVKPTNYSNSYETIPKSINYVHANRADQINKRSNDSIVSWRNRTTHNIIVYVNDVNNANIPWSPIYILGGYGYRYGGSVNSTVIRTEQSNTKIWKYLMQDGPFTNGTQLSTGMTFSYNSTSTTIDMSTIPDTGVVLVTNSNGTRAGLVFDIKNNIVFLGEPEFFGSGYSTTLTGGTLSGDKNKFLGNVLAYIVNAAQYGPRFTLNFMEDSW